jgi:hypothetical protein
LNPIHILQKKVIWIITFSKFDEHTSPLFKELKILKFPDLVTFHISIFMYKFHNNILPSIFESFFTRVDQVHNYRTRSSTSESYYIPKVRTMIMDYLILDIKVQLYGILYLKKLGMLPLQIQKSILKWLFSDILTKMISFTKESVTSCKCI